MGLHCMYIYVCQNVRTATEREAQPEDDLCSSEFHVVICLVICENKCVLTLNPKIEIVAWSGFGYEIGRLIDRCFSNTESYQFGLYVREETMTA